MRNKILTSEAMAIDCAAMAGKRAGPVPKIEEDIKASLRVGPATQWDIIERLDMHLDSEPTILHHLHRMSRYGGAVYDKNLKKWRLNA